eukprot:TRINITY_DN59_c1_g2_i3.p1 TRINITY_DN59_c1_g2~~TRINITY_DN59_c1_g2_i3.p1  ORF type:complete len:134 (-),score=7.19 TRINITY_DN59_c1_g2_i3:8-409(-)
MQDFDQQCSCILEVLTSSRASGSAHLQVAMLQSTCVECICIAEVHMYLLQQPAVSPLFFSGTTHIHELGESIQIYVPQQELKSLLLQRELRGSAHLQVAMDSAQTSPHITVCVCTQSRKTSGQCETALTCRWP